MVILDSGVLLGGFIMGNSKKTGWPPASILAVPDCKQNIYPQNIFTPNTLFTRVGRDQPCNYRNNCNKKKSN